MLALTTKGPSVRHPDWLHLGNACSVAIGMFCRKKETYHTVLAMELLVRGLVYSNMYYTHIVHVCVFTCVLYSHVCTVLTCVYCTHMCVYCTHMYVLYSHVCVLYSHMCVLYSHVCVLYILTRDDDVVVKLNVE